MNDKDLIKSLERLNDEIIKIKNSNEFEIGNKIIQIKKDIEEKDFKNILKRLSTKKKLKKINEKYSLVNSFEERESENKNLKIVVYTCITGGYDDIKNPFYHREGLDYILFSNEKYDSSLEWIIRKIPKNIQLLKDNILINRYIKFHPFELFEKEYDFAIYIDGNITPVSDLSSFVGAIDSKIGFAMHQHCSRNCIYEEVKACLALKKGNKEYLVEEIEKYKKEKFPSQYGMLECNVIAVDLKNNKAKKIFKSWWNEFMNSKSNRDQIALPYILWKYNIKVEEVAKLGTNVYRNNKLMFSKHETRR